MFYIGHGLTKSEKMAILAAHNGHFFACQFPPTANYPELAATSISGIENVKRSATDARLIEADIKNSNNLDPNQEVRGSLTLQALCDKKAKYGVRLTYKSLVLIQRIEWTPARSRGVERIEFRELPLAVLNEHGPNLLFVELCRFPERDDEPYAIVSDPLPVPVNIR